MSNWSDRFQMEQNSAYKPRWSDRYHVKDKESGRVVGLFSHKRKAQRYCDELNTKHLEAKSRGMVFTPDKVVYDY